MPWLAIASGVISVVLLLSAFPGPLETDPGTNYPGLGIVVGSSTSKTGGASSPNSAPGQSQYPTQPSGNFSIHVPGPVSPTMHGQVKMYPGSAITIEYNFSVLNYSVADQNLSVRVPQTVGIFPGANGYSDVRVFDPARNFTVRTPEFSNGTLAEVNLTESNYTLASSEVFDSKDSAIFSSQQVAVMTSRPWEAVTLAFLWRWIFTVNSTSSFESNWTGGLLPNETTAVTPAEEATLDSTSSTTMVNGGYFSVCLGGEVGGRDFSLNLGTLNNTTVTDFVQVNASIPSVAPLPFCWQAWVPTWVVPPQVIRAQVWNYEPVNSTTNVTLMLFLVLVKIVRPAAPAPSGFLGVSDSAWLEAAVLAAGLAVLGVAVILAIRYRRLGTTAKSPVSSSGPPKGGDQPGESGPAEDGDGAVPPDRRLR
jgi:hypothetical protein